MKIIDKGKYLWYNIAFWVGITLGFGAYALTIFMLGLDVGFYETNTAMNFILTSIGVFDIPILAMLNVILVFGWHKFYDIALKIPSKKNKYDTIFEHIFLFYCFFIFFKGLFDFTNNLMYLLGFLFNL